MTRGLTHLVKKYQIVAWYDDHIIVMDANAPLGDYSSKKEIKI